MKFNYTILFLLTFSSLLGQTPLLPIHDIQGTGNTSPFLGQTVTVDNCVVLFARPEFAYVQSAVADEDPLTSEGLLITGGDLLSLVPGDLIRVTGQVRENDNSTSIGGSVSIASLGTAPLPEPTELTAATVFDPVSPYERFEGMLVRFALTLGQGSNGFNSVRAYPTADRPFREPGLAPPGINGLPLWDGNPEIISFDPNGLGQSNESFYNAGDQINGVGIVEHFSFGYELSPTAPTNEQLTQVVRLARRREIDELSIGSINTLFLLEEEDNYALKLTKIVNYIGNSLNYPDVVAIQEIGGQEELEDLIFRLRQANPERGNYRGVSGSGTGSLRNAYLYSNRITEPTFTELGTGEFLSSGGILHDRPPFLMTFAVPGDEQTQLQILNLHLRSLNDIESSDFVRRKRHEQGISVANMVQNLRQDNLVIVGDYNAFEFSDGYVDVFNQIAGLPSEGALFPVEEIVSPPLRDLSGTLLEANQRYSFVFRGSAQQIDHCLSNDLAGLTANDLQFARGNADASVNFAFQAFAQPRASDHDGFVLYLGVDALSNLSEGVLSESQLRFPNPARAGDIIQYEQLPRGTEWRLVDVWGRIIETSQVQTPLATANQGSFNLPQQLIPGWYTLQLRHPQGNRSFPLIVTR